MHYSCIYIELLSIAQFTGEDDLNITNQPVVIPVGKSEACFQLVAVDDETAESNETFTLVVEATNPNDMVDGNTTCLLYTSPSPRDATLSRMPSSA